MPGPSTRSTTRHHDGFALWPSLQGELSVAGPAPGLDLVRDVDACRTEGLRVGLYYSLSDWHHPDYPAWRDEDRPYPFIAYPRPEPAVGAVRPVLRGQLTELLSDYGDIDELWLDGQWERTADLWDAEGLRELVRQLQPDCLVNDRLPGQGDFETPEQFVPATPPEHPWEACQTMNASWGWNVDDTGTSPAASWSPRSARRWGGAGTCSSTWARPETAHSRPSNRNASRRSPSGWTATPRPYTMPSPGRAVAVLRSDDPAGSNPLPPSADAALRHRHRAWGTHRAGGT